MTDDLIATVQLRIAAEQDRLANIESEIASLRSARERAESEVARLNQFIHTYYDITGIQPPENPEQVVTGGDTPRRPKNPSREIVATQALQIISEYGRPVARKELFDALAQRGVNINGKDPEMVLSTMLWRESDKIVRLPNHGYWPKEKDYSQAHYYPAFDDVMGAAANEPEDGVEADDAE